MEKISFGSIISKAVLLVGIIAAITFFQNQFGAENMLVGIALITALLMFLKADLGIKPSQAPFLIVGLFVAIVLVALLSNISPFAALAFNLVFIFFIMYFTTECFDDKAYLPFMLCYVFIQGMPVTGEIFEARLIAVVAGGIVISLVYLLTHRKKPTPQATLASMAKSIDIHSDRFSFALRVAISVSVAMLVGTLLQTEKAMWVALTAFSLTQPNRLDVVGRFNKRILGTVVGTVIFVVVFMFLVPQEYQPIAMLLFGFVYMFAQDYQFQITLLTVNVLAISILLLDPGTAIFGRFALIAVGFVVAFLVNGIPWKKMLGKLTKKPV